MAVIRVEKSRDYTTMSNYHLRDKRLSLKAVGLLSKILSLPPDWDYTVAGLAAICKESKDAIRAALEELEGAGYILRRQVHKEDGTFGGNEYVVYERPPAAQDPGSDDAQQMRTVVGKPDNGETPLPENPSTGNPSTDNPTQLNTDRLSTEYNNPPIVPPEGDGAEAPKKRRTAKDAPKWKPERFAAFWEAYPLKKSKKRAISAWDKLRPSDELLVVMAVALKRQMRTTQWQKDNGDFIPYPSTWLNQKLWTDEVKLSPDRGGGGGWAEDGEVY